jgi:hypothetical protein
MHTINLKDKAAGMDDFKSVKDKHIILSFDLT